MSLATRGLPPVTPPGARGQCGPSPCRAGLRLFNQGQAPPARSALTHTPAWPQGHPGHTWGPLVCSCPNPSHTHAHRHTCAPSYALRPHSLVHLDHTHPLTSRGPRSSCAECLKFGSGPFEKNCSLACARLKQLPSAVTRKPCRERDSQGCWMTYTLRQRDGKDNYDIHIEETRGEAAAPRVQGRCGHRAQEMPRDPRVRVFLPWAWQAQDPGMAAS